MPSRTAGVSFMVFAWNVPTRAFAALHRVVRALRAISAPVGGPRRCAVAGPAPAARAALNRAGRALSPMSAPGGGPRRCAVAGPATAALIRIGSVAVRTKLDRMAVLLNGVAGGGCAMTRRDREWILTKNARPNAQV